MARYFTPQPEYKAPTFQELAAPLEIYRNAYNALEEKYDAQAEKQALLNAMLGSEPDSEIAKEMSDYNALMDSTASQFSSGRLSYSQLYDNVKNMKRIWNDKGVRMMNAIDQYSNLMKEKKPGMIGPEFSVMDVYRNPSKYMQAKFFDPNDIFTAGALAGTTFANQKGPRNGKKGKNGKWLEEYGPTNGEIAGAFNDENNPFYESAVKLAERYGVSEDDPYFEIFKNQFQQGLASAQKIVSSEDVDYINAYQRRSLNSKGSSNPSDSNPNNNEILPINRTYKDAAGIERTLYQVNGIVGYFTNNRKFVQLSESQLNQTYVTEEQERIDDPYGLTKNEYRRRITNYKSDGKTPRFYDTGITVKRKDFGEFEGKDKLDRKVKLYYDDQLGVYGTFYDGYKFVTMKNYENDEDLDRSNPYFPLETQTSGNNYSAEDAPSI